MQREFHGRPFEGELFAVFETDVSAPPDRVWQRLATQTLPERLPIAEGEGVGSTYTSAGMSGRVTVCDAPTSFQMSLASRGCDALCTGTLTSTPAGGTRCRIEGRFHSTPELSQLPLNEALWIICGWEFRLMQLAADAGGRPIPAGPSFEDWLDSADGKRALVNSVESWWRAMTSAGLDEGYVAWESNHVTRQILNLPDERDPHVQQLDEIQLKGAVTPYVDSTTDVVRDERDRSVQLLLAQVSEILHVSYAARGQVLGPSTWELDTRRYFPFRWIIDDKPVARFLGSPQVPYRVLEMIEFQLARASFERHTLDGVKVEPLDIELPIRQVGRVMRHEGAGLDRVDMSWSIPPDMVKCVEFDATSPPISAIQQATDENFMVVVTSHLGLPDALYQIRIQPDVVREYAIPPADPA